MAESATTNEASMRAVASKDIEKTSTGSNKEGKKAANAVRTQLAEEGSRKTLEGFISRAPKRGEIKAAANENLGTKIDSNGNKDRSPTEQVEFDDVIKRIDNIFQYLETGTLNVTDEMQVRADIVEIFSMYPNALDLVNEFGSGGITDTVINDPDFRKALQDRLAEIKANKVAELSPGAEAALSEARRAEGAKIREEARISGEVKVINAGLADFSTTPPVGKLRAELDQLISNIPQLKIDANRATSELRSIESQLKRNERQVDAIMSGTLQANNTAALLQSAQEEIKRLEGEREARQVTIDEHTRAQARKDQLDQDKASLEQRNKDIAPEHEKAQSELEALRETRINAETALARAKKVRSVAESEFKSSIEDVYKDAAVKYYESKVKDAEAAQQTLFDKQMGEAKNDTDRQVLAELGGNRWRAEDARERAGLLGRKNKNVVLPDVGTIDADYRQLLLNGPDATLKGILTGMGVKDEQMNEMLADPKYKDMMVKQLLIARMDTGRITKNEARAIATSEWGNQAIENALAGNKNAMDNVNKLKASGVFRGKTPAEWVKEHPGTTLASLLLLLLTPAAAVGVAALGGAGALGMTGAAIGGEAVGAGTLGVGAGIKKIGNMPI